VATDGETVNAPNNCKYYSVNIPLDGTEISATYPSWLHPHGKKKNLWCPWVGPQRMSGNSGEEKIVCHSW
jgi:hypothetical protein